MRRIAVTLHGAHNTSRTGGYAINGHTTSHQGYAKSINSRHGIENVCELRSIASSARSIQWGGLRQFKLHGTDKVSAVFDLHKIAYSLIRWATCSNRRWQRHKKVVAPVNCLH